MYTLAEAREILAGLRPRLDALMVLRADLAELRADLLRSGDSPLGGRAEAKAWEALIFAELEYVGGQGAQIKGYVPLLLDFPGEADGTPVLWCWLEGEPEVAWYHRADCGFAGRRPIPPPD